jgi:hypothetical protein
VYKSTHAVTVDGSSKSLTVTWVDLNDKSIKLDVVTAKGGVGKTDSLANIVNSTNDLSYTALAGVNGTFFNAYSLGKDEQPQGTIISNGVLEHISNTGSMMTFNTDNIGKTANVKISIVGGTNDQWEWPYSWYAWNINHFYTDPKATMLFNSDYKGYATSHTLTGIVVDKGVVTKVAKGLWEIPTEGFLVVTNDATILSTLALGVKAEYKFKYTSKEDGTDLTPYFDTVASAVGAGPTLISGSQIVVNPKAEGFLESKITEDKGTRTLLGITAKNKMGMVVVPSVSVLQLADIAKQLGMVEAINLDGGGSSGIYLKGAYVSKPGRNISNALVIKQLKQAKISVVLNNEKLLFDSEPFVDLSSKRTMVPLRVIAEKLGAVVGWDQTAQMITVTKDGSVVKLQNNSASALLNSIETTLDTKVVVRDNRTFVPLRFITTAFGGEIAWDSKTSTASINIATQIGLLQDAKADIQNSRYAQAVEKLEKYLESDKNNLYALKQLALLYNVNLKNYDRATQYYERVLALDPKDLATANTFGWMVYSTGSLDKAITIFEAMIQVDEKNAVAYYGLAQCYSSYKINNVEKAKSYFRTSIDLGLGGDSKIYAENYLKSN